MFETIRNLFRAMTEFQRVRENMFFVMGETVYFGREPDQNNRFAMLDTRCILEQPSDAVGLAMALNQAIAAEREAKISEATEALRKAIKAIETTKEALTETT